VLSITEHKVCSFSNMSLEHKIFSHDRIYALLQIHAIGIRYRFVGEMWSLEGALSLPIYSINTRWREGRMVFKVNSYPLSFPSHTCKAELNFSSTDIIRANDF